MQTLSQLWDDMCGLIIRPQRCEYEVSHLGPQLFRIDDGVYERTDVTVYNPRGMELKCSHFEPTQSQRPSEKMPCVVYLHGNCGSRQDSLDCVTVLLPHGISLFSFDFSGSGLSEGEYVSLGHFEKQDLATIIDYLQSKGTTSRVGLWGRSMGAVTSIMYASKDPTIAGIVCDSPFSSLPDLMQELVLTQKPWVPKFLLKAAINSMRSTITKKVGFDIHDLNTIKYASSSDVPALLAHAKDDLLVDQRHSKLVQQAYQGECALMGFEGGHNTDRPEFFLDAVTTFFIHHLITKPPPTDSRTPIRARSTPQASSSNHVDPMLVLKEDKEEDAAKKDDEKEEVCGDDTASPSETQEAREEEVKAQEEIEAKQQEEAEVKEEKAELKGEEAELKEEEAEVKEEEVAAKEEEAQQKESEDIEAKESAHVGANKESEVQKENEEENQKEEKEETHTTEEEGGQVS
eukprot:TRINITY_DN4043_c2_g1_i1.p1 TRINITY_DN4043_c2_g1~~TRINITY_DN4043_c2_g1_i1.p1  ORF type:complete len:486 (+),score=148.43 TRINITY_DN4043_c2_g1_i1:81-1460(+)